MARRKLSPTEALDKKASFQKQVDWLYSLVKRFHESPSAHGLKWTAKMIIHYNKQYRQLRAHTPRGLGKWARGMDAKFDTIVRHYT